MSVVYLKHQPTSIPSLDESNKLANSVMNSGVIRRGRSSLTSATFPNKPIMLRSRSSLSGKSCQINMNKLYLDLSVTQIGLTFKHPRKYSMPRPSRKRSQFFAVSSVTFHMVDQATSITSSKILRDSRSLIRLSIVCKKKISSFQEAFIQRFVIILTEIAPKSPRNIFWLPSTWQASEFSR